MRDFSPSGKFTLDGQVVLVTGGTGSFGQALVRTVLERYSPRKLIVYSRDELKQYEMAQIFPGEKYGCMRFLIGDVRDCERLKMAVREADVIIHAAALKHVPIAEYNPMECLRTNVDGAENVVRAALDAGVKKVVALSTDKAANPINLYGASKLASDKVFVAANNLSGSIGSRFSVVRYGNVVGSRGSVIPFFQKLAKEGADYIPITDERMTRFWITIQQGVDFVLSSLEIMHGGEIFVPRIPSMKVIDVANVVAPGIKQKMVGIRPGEKLHEVMVPSDDARHTVRLEDRYVIRPAFVVIEDENKYVKKSRPVDKEFTYSSDLNDEWLDETGLKELISHSGKG